MKIQRFLLAILGLIILVGIGMRFYHITDADFIFYDEGYYLNWSRPLGEVLSTHQLKEGEGAKAVEAFIKRSFASGKTLWFLIADSRYFWSDYHQLYMSRFFAALFGLGTLGLTFLFARKYFENIRLALLATALLAILPSHVFYSRIGMQESLSTFLVLAGFYFYLFPRKFSWRTFAAGACWGAAFFSNYRLIMLPALITFTEIYFAWAEQRRPDARKWLWAVLTFTSCVVLFGSLNKGENSFVIFSWIFHQTDMAATKFSPLNFLSYPYYFFRLETIGFGALFFATLYFIKEKNWKPLFLTFIVCCQMFIFSLASEKGARYLCAVLPFAAMAVAYFIQWAWSDRTGPQLKRGVIVFTVLTIIGMGYKSFLLTQSHSAYRESARLLLSADPNGKFFSTQSYVQNLYATNAAQIIEPPPGFPQLLTKYSQGYRYLVVCPQAFVSMTDNRRRFTSPLRGYLGFIYSSFQPQKVYPHFNDTLLERFVLDHNEDLMQSIRFLNAAEQQRSGELRVYDLAQIIPPMLKVVADREGRPQP